ncbi:uncharacterized protein LOC123306300 isoform X2 [Coccinella septempunctata]|uniref:uncharacterized protein LOC123306300 isoform X2 n=1 Tax=Coccinella septempunctata TaxID=41139 RepID=UPI001D098D29|nr:uncharacterized protein LOC123306300 isoform X2 [Coccinella septempunctata]
MGVKFFNYVLILWICLHTATKSTATITQADVESCITDVKKRLATQQTTTKKRFEELRIRKMNDMKEQQKERYDNLIAYIQNEKNILSTLKQSAIQDDFNVTMCNDTSLVYDLISTSFRSSGDAILAEYKGVVDRNHTQNSLLVDRLALNYQQLEKKLASCQQQTEKLDCFDEVEDDCEIIVFKNDIFDQESSYYADAEKIFGVFKSKINALYERKLREVQSFSSDMKSCYKSVKNINTTTTIDVTDSGVSFHPTKLLVILPLLYKVFL